MARSPRSVSSSPVTAPSSGPPGRRPPVKRSRRLARTLIVVVLVVVAGAVAWALFPSVRTTGSRLISRPGTQALDPSEFSSGACVAMDPTVGDRHLTVFLDAGHGGIDPGAVGTATSGATVDEATETLPVELDTAALLRAQGFRVVVSRTTDSSVVRLTAADLSDGSLSLQGAHDDVAARDICANIAHADVLVGIYFDSGGSTDNAGSLTTYDADRPFSSDNERLATLLQQDVLAAMNAKGWQIPNGGVQSDASEGSIVPTNSESTIAIDAAEYGHVLLLGPAMAGYFTTPSQMPGALIEPLFVTDPFEASLAASSAGQQAMAQGLDQAINQYFGPAKTSKASTTSTP